MPGPVTMMDVLHVVHGYAPAIGGTEFLFQRISEELVARYGDRVTVYTTNGYNPGFFVDPSLPAIPIREGETLNGVEIRRFPVNNRIAPRLFALQAKAFAHNWPIPRRRPARPLTASGPATSERCAPTAGD